MVVVMAHAKISSLRETREDMQVRASLGLVVSFRHLDYQVRLCPKTNKILQENIKFK